MPHFQLVTVDGTALGARELDGSDWRAGSIIDTGPEDPVSADYSVLSELEPSSAAMMASATGPS